jgi:hypothetical protein
MREIRRLAWAAGVVAATALPGLGQQGGGTASGVGGSPTALTTSGNTAGNVGTGGNTGTSGTSPNSNQAQLGGTALTTLQQAPSIALTGMAASGAINTSNQLGTWFANPYYLGTWTNNTKVNNLPGGFGSALYPYTGPAGGTTTGRGGVGGGGLAGQAGRAGATGSINDPNIGGQIVALPRQIAYSAVVRFNTPASAPAPAQLLTDLRGAVDRTPTAMLANPAAVQFQVDGRAVTLRGAVKDEDEARLVEGMVRLTPGVGLIRNELTYPGR